LIIPKVKCFNLKFFYEEIKLLKEKAYHSLTCRVFRKKMAGFENIHDKKKPQQKKTKHNETKRRTNTRGFIEIILFFKLLGLKKMETL